METSRLQNCWRKKKPARKLQATSGTQAVGSIVSLHAEARRRKELYRTQTATARRHKSADAKTPPENKKMETSRIQIVGGEEETHEH